MQGVNLATIVTNLQNIQKAITGISFPLRLVPVPASDAAPGTPYDFALDANFAYFCVATDTWRRVAIAGGF